MGDVSFHLVPELSLHTRGIIPAIHALSRRISPQLHPICTLYFHSEWWLTVFYYNTDQLYVSKLSPCGYIFKLSHNLSPAWQPQTVAVTHRVLQCGDKFLIVWRLYPVALPLIFLPEEGPTCLFNPLLTADCYTQTTAPYFCTSPSSTVHFSLFILFLHTGTFVCYSFFWTPRHKWVFVREGLPVEWALREYCRELHLSETDHMSPRIPDQQWHLQRYCTPFQHQSVHVHHNTVNML